MGRISGLLIPRVAKQGYSTAEPLPMPSKLINIIGRLHHKVKKKITLFMQPTP
jgi:hypothetical protein